MVHEGRRDGQVLVSHEWAPVAELVNVDQWHQRHPVLVDDPDVDVSRVHFEEQPGHLLERWRSPSIDTGKPPRAPRKPNEVPVVGIVVRMMVREENVPESGHRHSSKRELARDAVAAIDDIRRVVRHDDLCGGRTTLAWPGPAARTKKDQSGPHALRSLGAAQRRDHQRRTPAVSGAGERMRAGRPPQCHVRHPVPQTGRPSNTLNGDAVGTTCLSTNPAAANSWRNSSSVRSRPPGVSASISRSAKYTSVSMPTFARSGRTRSTTTTVPSGGMARRHAARMALARGSSQS